MTPPPTRPVHRKPPLAARQEAEALAADILAYLAEDEARILRFFDLTGLTPQSLRGAAGRPDFPASMIEYLASDDRLLLAFAAARGHDPARLEAIRQALADRVEETD